MKLLAAAGDIGSTIAQIRLGAPLAALATADSHELRQRSVHDITPADLEWADVLVAQRPLDRRAWRQQVAMRRSGGAVVVEIDDLLTEMPLTLLHAERVRKALPWLTKSLAAADVVSVSTARLGEALAVHTRRWMLTPNHGAGEPCAPRSDGAGPVTLLFVSSDHVPVAAVAAALKRLQGAAPFNVTAIGPVADDLAAHGIKLTHQAAMPRDAFATWVRGQHNALAVIPVGDTAFDRCKSAIKFYDYALAGVPVLCADRPPYSGAVRDGHTALCVADTPEAWAAALRRLLDDPALRSHLALAAGAEVMATHRLQHSAQAWRELLASVPTRIGPARAAVPWWERTAGSALRAIRRANRARLARVARRRPR